METGWDSLAMAEACDCHCQSIQSNCASSAKEARLDMLKQALRRLAKAVVLITSTQEGVRYAMAATAVTELSFDPPSMLICVNRSASIHPALAAGAPFAINILHHSHEIVAARCAGSVKGEARFEIGDWRSAKYGVPVLADAQAAIVCRTDRQIEYGTHTIFIGAVADVLLSGRPEPLIYLDARFTRALDVESSLG